MVVAGLAPAMVSRPIRLSVSFSSRVQRRRTNHNLTGRAGWSLFLFLLPRPAPLRGYILGYSCQDNGRNQKVDDQVDPIGIAELQSNLRPEGDNLQDEGIEPDPPPVLEEEGYSRYEKECTKPSWCTLDAVDSRVEGCQDQYVDK